MIQFSVLKKKKDITWDVTNTVLNSVTYYVNSHAYRVYKENFPGKIPLDRPQNRCKDQIKQDLPLLTLEIIAPDRDRWKKEICKDLNRLCI